MQDRARGACGEILGSSGSSVIPKELLVGVETSDDAAVYQLNERQAVVATTDFFMPIVDDPYDFGMIAATNAISDVYAMGGTPLFALALVGMPIDKLPVETIRRILDGGEAVCARAGIPIAGGHTIDSVEPIYGLVVIGLVDPQAPQAQRGRAAGRCARARQAARHRRLQRGIEARTRSCRQHYAAMLASTTQLNTPGIAFGAMPAVHALTDVTGFGLIGHLLEICRASSAGATIEFARVPLHPGVLDLPVEGIVTGASARNWAGCADAVDSDAARRRRRARVVDRSANVGRPAGRVRTGCGRRRPGRLPGRGIRRCRDRSAASRRDRRASSCADALAMAAVRHVPRRRAPGRLRPSRRAPPSDSIPLPISG